MSRLRSGVDLTPDRGGGAGDDLPGYRIVGAAGKPGGFGITYVGIKLPVDTPESDFSSILWLEPNAKVAIKEFYPQQFAERDSDDARVRAKDEGEEYFDIFLDRFRKEAERLFLLTCLHVLRSVDRSDAGSAPGDLKDRIDDFFAELDRRSRSGFDPAVVGQAVDLIADFDAPMRRVALAALARRNLPAVYDYFEANGTAYYVMEYLDGGTLKERTGPASNPAAWPWTRLSPFIDGTLDGLNEMHRCIPGQPLIHCDIKPGNVMFRSADSDRAVLIDVGLARSTDRDDSVSHVPGLTVRYAAPELIAEASRPAVPGARSRIGPRTDIYAMAVVFAELANTRKGTRIPTMAEREAAAKAGRDTLGGVEFPATYPPAFAQAIRHALDFDPARRPQSVDAWRDEFRAAPPTDDAPPIAQRGIGNAGMPAGALRYVIIVAIVLLAGFVCWSIWGRDAAPSVAVVPIGNETVGVADPPVPDRPTPTPSDMAEPVARPPIAVVTTPRARPSDMPVRSPTPVTVKTSVAPLADAPRKDATPSFPAPRSSGLTTRPIRSADRIADLRRSSGGVVVDPVEIQMKTTDFDWLGDRSKAIVRACDNGSAAAALTRAAQGAPVCVVNDAGDRLRSGR